MKRSKGEFVVSKGKTITGRTKILAITAVVVVIVGAIAGTAIYRKQIAPFQTTVLIVNNTEIEMGYFLKRVRMSGQEPLAVLQALAFEEIIKQVAPKPPYRIGVSEADVDLTIRQSARGENRSITDDEFAEWYRQRLNEIRLSDAEFRDLTRESMLRARLTAYLAERTPTVVEQVHLYAITLRSLDDAQEVKASIDAGEDYFELARELNSDETLKEKGGELGWFARGALAPNLARIAFDNLDVGEVSDPLRFGGQTFAIFMISERDAAREIDEASLEIIKSRVLDVWLAAEFRNQHVEYHGFNNGFDSETDAWIKWQLEKM